MTSAMPAMTRIWFVSASSCLVSGVFSTVGGLEHAADVADLGRHARWSSTRMVPAPRVTWQFMNAMSTRSPRAASAATASTCLGVGTLSPVSADSSISRVAAGQDAGVGRDEVAGLDVHDVARDELVHRDLDELAVAPDLRLDDHHRLRGPRRSPPPCPPGSSPSRR